MVSLDSRRHDLGHCTFCPKLCRFCCPTAEVEHRDTVTPWAKMSLAEMVRMKRLDALGDVGEVFYHCFACLHCRTHCEHQVDVPGALVEARALVQAAGAWPDAVSRVVSTFYDTGNPWGEDLRSLIPVQVDEKYLIKEAQAVLFPGCEVIRQRSGFLKRVMDLLFQLGVDYVAVFNGDALCCGAPLWQAGDLEGFKKHAKEMSLQLSSYRQVICPCPTCVYLLKALYAELALTPLKSVVHLVEFLAPLLRGFQPARRISGVCAFHDPCYLSRFLGQEDLPRRLLEQVLEEPLVESVWSKRDAGCCGGGGLVPQVLPEVAAATAARRMDQLRGTGARRLITACPGCVRQLSSVADALPVSDLADVLFQALCGSG